MLLQFEIPTASYRFISWRKCRGLQPARWTCRRWRNTSHVSDMLTELEWPTLEDRREQASLAFFHKIHSGTVAIEGNKYLTPASRWASHELQYILWRPKILILSPHHSHLECTVGFCGLGWVHRGAYVYYLRYKARGMRFSMPLIYWL